MANEQIEAIAEPSLASSNCRVCRRELTDPESVSRGIRPVCAQCTTEEAEIKQRFEPQFRILQVNTTLDLRDISINPKYQKAISNLKTDEYIELKKSIAENGLYEPITINQDNVILDGHHRFKICRELGVIPRFTVKIFETPLDEEIYVYESNLIRRHLNDFQKVELALPLQALIAEKARQQQLNRGEDGRFLSDDKNGLPIHTHIEVSRKIGVSPAQVNRAKKILENGSDELKQRVRDGKTSIAYAYKSVNLAEKHSVTPQMPSGIFNVIYADPPWEYDIMTRGAPNEHYSIMHLDEIKELHIPTDENAILFLWATNPKLKEALEVVKAWGFEYKTNLVWIKDKIGNGYYVRGKHELLLIAKRGEMYPPIEENRPPSVLTSPSTEHSQKPTEVYALIEKMYPSGKYLELFARNLQEKWTSWGNEL